MVELFSVALHLHETLAVFSRSTFGWPLTQRSAVAWPGHIAQERKAGDATLAVPPCAAWQSFVGVDRPEDDGIEYWPGA